MLERLTLLEFDDLVTLGDVAEVIGRFEMVRRVSREVGRYIVQLGTEGRLVRMQADELTAGVDEQYALSCATTPTTRRRGASPPCASDSRELPPERLLEPEAVAHELGLTAGEHAEQHLRAARLPRARADPDASRQRRQPHRRAVRQSCRDRARDRRGARRVDGVGERRAKADRTRPRPRQGSRLGLGRRRSCTSVAQASRVASPIPSRASGPPMREGGEGAAARKPLTPYP